MKSYARSFVSAVAIGFSLSVVPVAPVFATPPPPNTSSDYCNQDAKACAAISNMLDNANGEDSSSSGSTIETQEYVHCIKDYQQEMMELAHLYATSWKNYVAHGMAVKDAKLKATQNEITPERNLLGHYQSCMGEKNHKMN